MKNGDLVRCISLDDPHAGLFRGAGVLLATYQAGIAFAKVSITRSQLIDIDRFREVDKENGMVDLPVMMLKKMRDASARDCCIPLEFLLTNEYHRVRQTALKLMRRNSYTPLRGV